MELLLPSEGLNLAADLLEHEGWYGAAGGDGGSAPTCASNAIYRVYRRLGLATTREHLATQRALAVYIGGEDIECIWRWNDAPGRTKLEVVSSLRAAALVERVREGAPVSTLEVSA